MKRYCLQTAAWLLSLLLACVPICSAEGNTDLYREDFESKTMDGWVSYEDKSGIVETEDGYAYCVRSYDYNSKTSSFSDYDFSLRMKVDYKDGSAAPTFYLRRGADGNRYEVYIDSASGKMVIDRVVNEEKTLIGEVAADFAADNNQWVSVRFVLSGKNIWIYYRDLEQPAAQLRDEFALKVGGIGFGFGNADFIVDDLVISDLSEPLPEPYEINPEEKKDYKDSPFFEEIDRLIAFGIVNAYDDGTFRPNLPVTRAEFAALAVRARNIPCDGTFGSTAFSDLPPDNWAAPYAAAVYVLGYMTGTGDGCFLPNAPITIEQSAKVLAQLLGAGALCERRGGYPSGYLTYASQEGILKGVEKEQGEALTRAEVAKLIANTLETEMLRQTGFGALEEYSREKGVTPLSQYHDIYVFKGRVAANYFAGIFADEPLGKNEILLDDTKMEVGATNAHELLGYFVTAYAGCAAEAEVPEMIWLRVEEMKSNVLKIAAEDILDGTGTEEVVYRDADTGKTVRKALSKNTNLILNGGSASFTEENLKPKIGSLTLFDTDDDGIYETALAENYHTLVTGSVSLQQKKIYDKYNPQNVLALDEQDAEIAIYKGYQQISFENIAPHDVLSIAQTEDGASHAKITVRVSEKKIQGKIEEYELDGDVDSATVKGKNYTVSDYCKDNIENGRTVPLRAGAGATLFLDSYGNIAAAELTQYSDFMLLNAVMWKGGADNGWQAELFTSSGEWQTAKFASDVLYNGQKEHFLQDTLPEDLYQRQIAKVKFNSKGMISSIDTALGERELVRKRVYDEWPMEYIPQTKSFDTDSYVDEQTLVFAVPYHTDEKERYIVSDYTYFNGGSTYRLWSYNEDKYEVADIILVFEKEDAGGNGKYARPFFFRTMTKALDSNGNEVRKINGYCAGEEVSYSLAEDAAADLDCGDALVLSRNGKGEIVGCKYLYRASDGDKGSDNSDFGMSGDRITVTGKVLDYDAASGRALLDVGNGQKKEKAFLIGGAGQVYCCDRMRKKINKTTVSEICVGDFIFMDFSWNELRDIMIYRN